MRAWTRLVLLAAALAAVAWSVDGKPLEPLERALEPCPPSCRCFYSEGLRRADCKHVPEWADHVYDAQDVRIIPPPAGRGSRSSVLHLTHLDVFPKALELSITNRSVVDIIPGGFHGMHSLQELDLSNNLLSHFNEKVFRRMPALRRLVLQGNPIKLEPDMPLLTSSSLRSLDLSFCEIVYIPKGSLDGVRNLTALSLRANPLSLDSHRPLLPIVTLLDLDLSACELEVIPPKSLDNLVNLQRLYLDGNNLKTVDKGVLPRGLHVLDLSSNQIRTAPTAVISSFKNLTKLEMGDNPMKCTCSLISLQDWMSRRVVVSQKPVVCAEPEKYKGLPWTKVNELELCRAEAAEADEYSSSDSDTSEDSDTTEDDDSSQSSSIDLPPPPPPYETYTNEENIIKNRQPAIQLDSLLEKKALYLQSNNEENSIQSDQPYASATHTDYPLEDEPHHEHIVQDRAAGEEEATATPTETAEDQDDKEDDEEQTDELVDEKEEQESGNSDYGEVETETKAPDGGVEAQDLIKSDNENENDGTENPNAEVFMKNRDTIAMGKSMPNGDSLENTTGTENDTSNDNGNEEDREADYSASSSTESTSTLAPPLSHSKEEYDGDAGSSGTSSTESASTAQPDIENGSEREEDTSQTLPTESTPTDDPPLTDGVSDYDHNEESGESSSTESNPTVAPTSVTQDLIETPSTEEVGTQESSVGVTEINVPDSSSTPKPEVEETSTVSTETPAEILPISEGGDRSEYGKSMEMESVENNGDETATEPPTNVPQSIIPLPVNPVDHDEMPGGHSLDDTQAPTTAEPAATSDTEAGLEDIYGKDEQSADDIVPGVEEQPETKQPSNESGDAHPPVPVPEEPQELPEVEEEVIQEVAKNVVENSPEPIEGEKPAEEKPEVSSKQTINIDDESELVTERHEGAHAGIPNYTVDKTNSASGEKTNADVEATLLAGEVSAGREQSQELATDNVNAVPSGGNEEIQKSTVTYIILGCIVIAIVVLIVYALLRGKSDKKDGKTPVRIRRDDEDPGTEMKDMMNPLLEPAADQPAANEFQDEPRRVSLVSLELIREVEEDNLTEGKSSVEDSEATDPPKAPKTPPGAKTADAPIQALENLDGKIADVVIESPPSVARKQPNGQPVANGKSPAPPRQNSTHGTPTVASKVKVVAGIIPAPIPRTPVLINRVNGVSTVITANGINGLKNGS